MRPPGSRRARAAPAANTRPPCLCVQGQEHERAAGAERGSGPAPVTGPGALQGGRRARTLQASITRAGAALAAALAASLTSFFFSPPPHSRTICILCAVMGSSPWEILFSQQQLILLLLSQPCLILNNSSMHANKETANRDSFFFAQEPNKKQTNQAFRMDTAPRTSFLWPFVHEMCEIQLDTLCRLVFSTHV